MDTAAKRERSQDEAAGEPSKRASDSLFHDEDESDDDDKPDSDRGSMASVSSFDDGYDSELMGDDDDRDAVEAMPGLERETLLAERHAARERGRELVQVRRRQLQQRLRAASEAARAARKPRRRLRREAASGDEEEGGDVRGAVGKAEKPPKPSRSAARQKKQQEEEDEASSDEELPEFAGTLKVREEAEDDSDYEGAARSKLPGGKKGRHRWGDEEELFGASGREAFGDEDDEGGAGGYNSDGEPLGGRGVAVSESTLARVRAAEGAEGAEPLTLAAINECKVPRDFLARGFHEPWFKAAVKGLPVRVHLGTTDSGSERYRVCRVAEVVRHGRPYPLVIPDAGAGVASAGSARRTGSRVVTNRCLLLYVAHKDEGKPFPFSRVSNGPITEAELAEYLAHLREHGREPPRPAWLARRWASAQAQATQHAYTVAEVDAMLARQLSAFDASGVRNLAIAKAEAQARLDSSRLRLFEQLSSLAVDKSTVKLPADDSGLDAAVATAVAAMEEDAAAQARVVVSEAAATAAKLRTVIAAVEKEAAKRRAEAQARDTAARRNSNLNKQNERRNLKMRAHALRKHREAERRKEAMIRRVALAGGPKSAEEAEAALAKAREAAIDPIKRRDAVPAMIWRVKSESQARADREEWLRRNASGAQPGAQDEGKSGEAATGQSSASSSSSSSAAAASSSSPPAASAADQTGLARLLGASASPARSRKQLARTKMPAKQAAGGGTRLAGADVVLVAILADAKPSRSSRADSAANLASAPKDAGGEPAAPAPGSGKSLSLTELLKRRSKV